MKKKLFLSLLITLSLTSGVIYAAGREYGISAINLTVSIPEGLNVLTRNVSEGNPALDILDADAVSLQNSYIQNNIYLDAFPDDLTYEILITSTRISDSGAKDLTAFTDDEINEYINRVKADYNDKKEDSLLLSNIYSTDTATYVYTESHSTAGDVSSYVYKYYTIMNGYNYHFTLQTNDMIADDIILAQYKDIIDSASYEYVKASITESPIFMDLYEAFVGFGLTILILGTILVLLIRSTKKR